MTKFIAPSILSADFNNLQNDIEMINHSDADYIHFDVMDGVFVPNISFGIPVIEHVNRIAKKPLDVHLMIVNPTNLLFRLHAQVLLLLRSITKPVRTCTVQFRL